MFYHCGVMHNSRCVLAVLMEHNGLILSESHIPGPFRSQDINCSVRAHFLPPQQIFAKLGLFGSEANHKNARCKDFSLVFALGLKGAEC